MLYCFEENWWSTVLKRTGALLLSGEGNRSSTVLKRTSVLLFSGEANRWPTVEEN